MVADAIRPPSITTAAWMSPCRDVPQPVYVPSRYRVGAGATGGPAAGACATSCVATGGASAAATGGSLTGAAGAGVTIAVGAFSTGFDGRFVRRTAMVDGGAIATGAFAAATAGGAAAGGATGVLGGAPAGATAMKGRRVSACCAKRSAAARVRT